MSSVVCNYFKKRLGDGALSLSGDNRWMCALVTSAISTCAVDDIREVSAWSELSATEVSGTGYTAGGSELTNISLTNDTTNDYTSFDADNLSWANSSLADVQGAVIYLSGGSPVMGFNDFNQPKTSENASFNVQWHDDGILKIN